MSNRIVIVGAGAAGGKATQTLREEGHDGPITIVGAESELPYQRPPLSKGFLMGEKPRDSVFLNPSQWFTDHRVEVLLGSAATALDTGAREVVLAEGARLPYDRLLIATGSRPRHLDVQGAGLAGVHYLRTLADSEALRESLGRASAVAVIGGGWIGLEVAAAARTAGKPVTLLESAPLPLHRVLGEEVAGVFADLHRDHGVDLRTGVSVSHLVGDGSVQGVVLGDSTQVQADLVVVGVGITPNIELAQSAGLSIDDGVVADEFLRTSDPAIWAAGDVVSAYHPVLGRHIRVEHAENALRQGKAVARSLLGRGEPYSEPPFFYTDQYDLGMEYLGHVGPAGYDEVVLRGDVAGLRFLAFWVGDGRVLAGMHVNIWDATDTIRGLLGKDASEIPA